jgi:hypothetical protein
VGLPPLPSIKELLMHHLVKDLTGQRFGRLTVLEHVGTIRARRAGWRCRCDCGATVTVVSADLLAGRTRSCGCLAQEVRRDLLAKHGQVGLPEFNTWRGIFKRCNSPVHPGYPTHGGAGVQCRWASFDEFVADVGERPAPHPEDGDYRLVRINPGDHFGPGTCRWMTRKQQAEIHSNYTRWK